MGRPILYSSLFCFITKHTLETTSPKLREEVPIKLKKDTATAVQEKRFVIESKTTYQLINERIPLLEVTQNFSTYL